MKDLLNTMNNEQLATYLNQYLRDIECSLDDDNYLNQFYIMDNNNDNFNLLIDEFNVKSLEQLEKTWIFTCNDDEFIQPMKYLTKDGRYIWIIRSYNKEYYYKCIEGHRYEIITELLKHC